MKTYKNFLAAFALFLAVLLLLPTAVLAANYPKHQNYVADEADILTEETIRTIKDTNKVLMGDYQLTIAVCTVKSTGSEDIGTYARNLFTNWKLGEGILLLLASDDEKYYFVPSVGMEDILTAEVLASVRDEQLEADFANGARDRAVYKTVVSLKNKLSAGMANRAAQQAAASVDTESGTESTEEKGTTLGSIIVGFFKFLLWLVLIAVILFIGVFVWAMFNDDVAAILQKLLFRRGKNSGRPSQNFYDERIYGSRSNAPHPQNPYQGQQRRPNPNGYNNARPYPPQNGYANVQNPNNAGYLPQGTYPQNPYGAQRPGQMPQNSRGYGQPMQAYPQQNGNYGYPGQAQPMQQNNGYPSGTGNGYYGNGYPQQPMNPNSNNRGGYGSGYGAQQNNVSTDATVQFNIPKRN